MCGCVHTMWLSESMCVNISILHSCICAYVPSPVSRSTHLVLEEGRVITNGCVDKTHHLMIQV